MSLACAENLNLSAFGQNSHLVVGAQYMNNDLRRQQLGKGTTGTDYDNKRKYKKRVYFDRSKSIF